jgi:hypothetical protein
MVGRLRGLLRVLGCKLEAGFKVGQAGNASLAGGALWQRSRLTPALMSRAVCLLICLPSSRSAVGPYCDCYPPASEGFQHSSAALPLQGV